MELATDLQPSCNGRLAMSTTSVTSTVRTVQESYEMCHNFFETNKKTYVDHQTLLSTLDGNLTREISLLSSNKQKLEGEKLTSLKAKLEQYGKEHSLVSETFKNMNVLSKCIEKTIGYVERTSTFSGLTELKDLWTELHTSLSIDREVSRKHVETLNTDLKTLKVFINTMTLLPQVNRNFEWFKVTVENDGVPKTTYTKVVTAIGTTASYLNPLNYFGTSPTQTTTSVLGTSPKTSPTISEEKKPPESKNEKDPLTSSSSTTKEAQKQDPNNIEKSTPPVNSSENTDQT